MTTPTGPVITLAYLPAAAEALDPSQSYAACEAVWLAQRWDDPDQAITVATRSLTRTCGHAAATQLVQLAEHLATEAAATTGPP